MFEYTHGIIDLNKSIKKLNSEYADGIIKSNGTVSFRKVGEHYLVADRDELIYDGYDYNVAESHYYNYLDRDEPIIKEFEE